VNSIELELQSLREGGLHRELVPANGIDFSSNDYLGLSRSPEIREKLLSELAQEEKLGATGSRLISGESRLYVDTETYLAHLFKADTALIFGSGYLANLGVLSALGSDDSEFFSDALNHASLIDGIRLSRGQKQVFRHNDLNHLESLLRRSRFSRKIVVTESVFSMDGDSPDLEALTRLCEKNGAILVVDEAHATGVCGKSGLGLMQECRSNAPRNIVVHTCGKALGSYGAFITCHRLIRELVIQKGRSLIYSTALPPYLLAHVRIAVEAMLRLDSLRKSVYENVAFARSSFRRAGFDYHGAHVGYLPMIGNERVLAASAALARAGFHVKAIRYPTVLHGSERLRVTFKSFNTICEIERLTQCLQELIA
jgi:8-amino-7-oxononanoate synthase